MSQQLLDRYSPAEAHVAARLVEGGDARREAAELLRESVGSNAAGEPRHRRARWLKALADALALETTSSFPVELRAALEAARDEAPGEGTVIDTARERALRLLEAEEELDAAATAARSGETERCETALSLAFAETSVFGPREDGRRCVRAAEALALAREDARADRLLRVARERYSGAGAIEQALSIGLKLGDRAWGRGEVATALSAFDEVRLEARFAEHPVMELAALRRLMALAALRSDPRAVFRLYEEIATRLAALPPEGSREKAISHWVAHCVLRRMGDRSRSARALECALEAAEAARDMPLAWLAAAQLGEPLPSELVRRLQKPPVEARDLCDAAIAVPEADPDLRRGYLEGALRMLEATGQDAELREICEKALEALPRTAA